MGRFRPHRLGRRPGVRRRTVGLAVAASIVLGACGPEVLVSTERADRIATPATPDDQPPGDPAPSPVDEPAPDDPPPDDPAPNPAPDDPPTSAADPIVTDPDAIDFGPNKPPRDHDDFLLASLADIEAWLTEEYPQVYGEPFVPLEGEVYAAYPERPAPLPGCGEPQTRYEDIQLYVAFYCPIGDFIIYDDGAGGLLATLAGEYGPATIGIVLAHEYGHAIQQRIGALDRNLPTVTTEQQADCISGAWAGRARGGQAIGVPFDDADVRAGLIAMIEVEDPIGTDPTAPGGHGSGFDRVGAFQVGFREGLARCAELLDDPLPLTPLRFLSQRDFETGGNAPFGFADDELFGFLVPDVNLFFDEDLDSVFPAFDALDFVATQSATEVACDDPVGAYDGGVVLCPSTDTVYLDVPVARDLYDRFGDFSIGYLIGTVWAEAAQRDAGSSLDGEERALRNDCLAGAWVHTVIPDENFRLPEPRHPDRSALVSPGDLTEAVLTAIAVGDPAADDDVVGSAFEKIDAFRRGTLGGIAACD